MKVSAYLKSLVAVALLTVAVSAVVVGRDSSPVDAACGLCAGGEFHPLDAPVRVFSSRDGINDVAPLGTKPLTAGSGSTFVIDLLRLGQSDGWLPATVGSTSDVLGVMATITVVGPSQSGYLAAYAANLPRPIASNVNFVAGQTVANLALLRPDSSGNLAISLVGGVAGTANVIVDVTGWFSTSSYTAGTPDPVLDDERGVRLFSVAPARILDTRNGAAADTPIGPSTTLPLTVRGGVRLGTSTPVVAADSGAVAAVLNVTAVAPTSSTYLSVLPASPVTAPSTSNLNAVAGAIKANLVIVNLDADGIAWIYNRAGNTNVVVDVVGYFAPVLDETRTGRVVPLSAPFRAFDTRLAAFGKVALGPSQAEDWSFAAFSSSVNIGGVAVGGQGAFLGNLTNASLRRASPTVPVSSYLTVYPPVTPAPVISNLNSFETSAVSNMALVKFGTDQVVRVFNSRGYAHYLIDVYAVVLS
jgi:hypothetical protein